MRRLSRRRYFLTCSKRLSEIQSMFKTSERYFLDRSREGRVAKILGVENYAPSMGALRSDGAISGSSNRFTDLVEGGEQASRRAVRRRFFRALNVCDTPHIFP